MERQVVMESIAYVALFFILRLGVPAAILLLVNELIQRGTRNVHSHGGD